MRAAGLEGTRAGRINLIEQRGSASRRLRSRSVLCRLSVSLEGRLMQGSPEAPRGVGRVFPLLAREWLIRGRFSVRAFKILWNSCLIPTSRI